MTLWWYVLDDTDARRDMNWGTSNFAPYGERPVPVPSDAAIEPGDILVMSIVPMPSDHSATGITVVGYARSRTYETVQFEVDSTRRANFVNVQIFEDAIDEPTYESAFDTPDHPPDKYARGVLRPLAAQEWIDTLELCSVETLIKIEQQVDTANLTSNALSASRSQLQFILAERAKSAQVKQLSTLRFKRLEVVRWRQFSEVVIEFHPRLTVLTGANGAGKTSLLHLLSPHFNWNNPFVSAPRRTKEGQLTYRSGAIPESPNHDESQPVTTARLTYSDDSVATVSMPVNTGTNYNVNWATMQAVTGLYIPSHRAIAGYAQVPQMPTSFSASRALLDQFLNEVRSRYTGGHSGKSAGQWMKESLIAAAYHGVRATSDDIDIEPNQEARDVWLGFQIVLRRLLPESLGFERLAIRSPEVVLVTRSGDFPLDAASGGINALIELGWQVFLHSRDYQSFTVLFDEPENHLHPELQRSILPRLLHAFPNVTFVVSTHSPFIVTSVKGAYVYALDYLDSGGVVAYRIDPANGVKSAEEVLRRVLGVNSTLPLWADVELEQILRRYQGRSMTPELLREVRSRLGDAGLLDEFPATAAALARDPNA